MFLGCLAPLAWLGWLAFSGGLGANPIEAAVRSLGDWGLRFLLLSLAITPAARSLNLPVLMRFRRMLGLFAFFYVCLHLLAYVGLDQFFDWTAVWDDIVKRTYITVGMAAFLLLLPLAATSTKGMIKRLGSNRWKRLHALVYPAAILACLHYIMMVKADLRAPLVYAGILMLLLGWRIGAALRRRGVPLLRRGPRPLRGSA
ncbi:MAG: sulfoxide reductase heme-binding subunit YedZ [Rhodospirillales bacterium]|nr:MAG: sulfoxide reductase heme-binding subunit YedZ [Rhodospirillales bacterium]